MYTPTLTGSGERVRLASREVGLHTHILAPLENVLQFEQLTEVVLGRVQLRRHGRRPWLEEQLPDQISHLICLDGFVPANGQSIGQRARLRQQIMGSLNNMGSACVSVRVSH